MNHDPSNRRALCATCQRALRSCLCRWVTPTINRVPVLVLQHPLEQGHAKGSLPLLRLSLAQCKADIAEVFSAEQQARWQQPGTCLLYPHDGTSTQQPEPAIAEVRQLVLLDGTWRKTRKLLHLNPALQLLPRCTLPALAALPPSRYAIRKAQQPDQRSTLEAACLGLGALEQRPAHYAPLLQAFSNWVDAQASLQPTAFCRTR